MNTEPKELTGNELIAIFDGREISAVANTGEVYLKRAKGQIHELAKYDTSWESFMGAYKKYRDTMAIIKLSGYNSTLNSCEFELMLYIIDCNLLEAHKKLAEGIRLINSHL